MPAKTAHFTITGDFLTQQARTFWLEGNFSRAHSLLECIIGTTKEEHHAVLFGTLKFEGDNEVLLVPDDWEPPEYYTSLADSIKRGDNWNELKRYREQAAWQLARDEYDQVKGYKHLRRSLHEKVCALVGEVEGNYIMETVMLDSCDRDRLSDVGYTRGSWGAIVLR